MQAHCPGIRGKLGQVQILYLQQSQLAQPVIQPEPQACITTDHLQLQGHAAITIGVLLVPGLDPFEHQVVFTGLPAQLLLKLVETGTRR